MTLCILFSVNYHLPNVWWKKYSKILKRQSDRLFRAFQFWGILSNGQTTLLFINRYNLNKTIKKPEESSSWFVESKFLLTTEICWSGDYTRAHVWSGIELKIVCACGDFVAAIKWKSGIQSNGRSPFYDEYGKLIFHKWKESLWCVICLMSLLFQIRSNSIFVELVVVGSVWFGSAG